MSSVAKTGKLGHQWTNFEMHTLLCLMAKGLHREKIKKGRRRSSDTPGRAKQHAHLEVATALNFAVHGNDYPKDIGKRDVSLMIDKILEERRAITGFNGYMERATPGRITRGLKRMWDRTTRFDYSGTQEEWRLGRRDKEMEKYRIARGGKPLITYTDDNGEVGRDNNEMDGLVTDIWQAADNAAASGQTSWINTKPAVPSTTDKIFPASKDCNAANTDASFGKLTYQLPTKPNFSCLDVTH